MSDLVRATFSLDKHLHDQFERLADERGYQNRSEFLRDLLRQHLVQEEWENDQEALGTITLVYDHHQRQLSAKLMDAQHDHHDIVLATTHVHLSHDLCAETIMLRGRANQIRAMADTLRKQKGVLHATLSMSSTGKALKLSLAGAVKRPHAH
jgi:CopG family transcriptional regulator, nickel-responsive regulator